MREKREMGKMRKIAFIGAIAVLSALAASCAGGGEAKQTGPATAPYQLPLSEIRPWYNAEFIGGDTIAFKGGGVDYLLPLEVKLAAYSNLALVYEIVDFTGEEAVGAKTGNSNTMQLSIKDWDGGDSRIDLTYIPLKEEGGEVTLLEGDSFAKLQQKGVEGFTIAANTWQNNAISTYTLKIISLELRP
jgi:hypothetical protein